MKPKIGQQHLERVYVKVIRDTGCLILYSTIWSEADKSPMGT